MSQRALPIIVLVMLFALALMSGGVLVWMSAITGPEPTPVQQQLSNVADWTIKGTVGALLGFAGGVSTARRNGR